MKNFTLIAFMLINGFLVQAQTPNSIFPGLTGQELLDSLKSNYRPISTLLASQAKDLMYSEIDNDQDSVRGFYTGHTKYLPSGVDPSVYLYDNGSADGINFEHVWPQSMGAGDYPQTSDLNIVRPTRVKANEDRWNYPFGEIDDNLTQRWYIGNKIYISKPSSNIDAYSEGTDSYWEPRESVKGDVARTIFYFKTMYPDVANLVFFNQQKDDMCAWHQLDPADKAEFDRAMRIAPYHQNRANPFILDCSLVRRCFCPELDEDCAPITVSVQNLAADTDDMKVLTLGNNQYTIKSATSGIMDQVLFVNTYGQVIQQWSDQIEVNLDLTPYPNGLYYIINNFGQAVKVVR